MEKIKVIALKSFDYGGTIRTPQSPPFEVDKFDLSYFVSNGMVKHYHEKDNVNTEEDQLSSNADKASQPNTKKKAKKDVTDNAG